MKALVLFFLIAAVGFAAPLLEKHSQRPLIIRSLQRLTDESAHAGDSHFYFARRSLQLIRQGARSEDWVYWPEGKRLWMTTLTPCSERTGHSELRAEVEWDLRLYTPDHVIDLEQDVVPDESDLHPLDWHVTADYVQRLIQLCLSSGEMIVIHQKSPTSR